MTSFMTMTARSMLAISAMAVSNRLKGVRTALTMTISSLS